MTFNVGDKVRIITDLKEDIGIVVPPMLNYAGMEAVIVEVSFPNNPDEEIGYRMTTDEKQWWWNDETLIPLKQNWRDIISKAL